MHPLSVRKRRFIKRQLGYLVEPVQRKVRVLFDSEQTYEIGGHPVVLPPSHKLPYYQERDPGYDRYAETILARLAEGVRSVAFIDIGANVGDTATAGLAAASNITAVTVEGNRVFLDYLRRNLAQFGDRVTVLEGFVSTGEADAVYRHDGSTGGFKQDPWRAVDESAGGGTPETTVWFRPDEIFDAADDDADLVVWKSDIDGYDIHVLAAYWDDIVARGDVIWFEYDPTETLGDRDDIDRLVGLLGASGRGMHIYDNIGNLIVKIAPGEPLEGVFRSMTAWLFEQKVGHVMVPYFDVWLFDDASWDLVTRAGDDEIDYQRGP